MVSMPRVWQARVPNSQRHVCPLGRNEVSALQRAVLTDAQLGAAADFGPLACYTALHVSRGGPKPLSRGTLGGAKEFTMIDSKGSDAELDAIGREVARDFQLSYGGIDRSTRDDLIRYYLGDRKFLVPNNHSRPAIREELVAQVELAGYQRQQTP